MANNRYIQIDDDTAVGYNYLKKKYYAVNKGTTTYRNTAEEIMAVLEAIKSTEIKVDEETTIILTAEYLKEHLYDPIEVLDKVYYTLEDNGIYIKTLQFNDWIDYPLEVDCDLGNISIKNTNILFSLKLDDSPESKVLRFCSYYLETLGLEITKNEMIAAFNLLANQYEIPYFYNFISKDEETGIIRYTNSFGMANFNGAASIGCNGIRNPNGESTASEIGKILSIDNENDLINLKEPVEPMELLMPTSIISIEGTEHEIDGTTYNADGTYTVNQLIFEDTEEPQKIKSIQVEEPIPSSYEYVYPTCYVQSLDCPIYSMERENQLIKVEASSIPENLLVGDTIYVENAKVSTTHEIVDLSGTYTVRDISTQIKQISDTVLSMGNNTIIISTSSTQLKEGDIIKISGTNTIDDKEYTISEAPVESSSYTTLTVLEDIPYAYGNYTSGDNISVKFETTSATNILRLPNTMAPVAINQGDLVQVTGITGTAASNNKLFTILQVTRNEDGSIVLSLDSSVVAYEGTATLTFTFMNTVTLTGSTVLYYNIYTEEEIATDYTSSLESQATFYKEVFVSNIIDIKQILLSEEDPTPTNSIITLEKLPEEPIALTVGNTLYIYIQENKFISNIESIDTENNEITLSTVLDEEMPDFPVVSLKVPNQEISTNIVYVAEELEDTISTGEFIVDNFEECQDYIDSLRELDTQVTSKKSSIPELTEDISINMYQVLEEKHLITIENLGDIEFKGLYTEIYPSQS